jgi:hypothetical protein
MENIQGNYVAMDAAKSKEKHSRYFSGIKNIFYQFVTIPIIPTPGVIIV